MSKSYPEHCISITEEPKNMYGKLMSIPDSLISRYYMLLTDISTGELKEIEEKIKTENPRDIKMKLAFDITKEYHGEKEAINAQNEFVNVVQNKGVPTDIPEYKLNGQISVVDLIVKLNFTTSKGEAKRLIQQGAVKFENEKISDINAQITSKGVLQAGKRKFVKIS